jgi:secondary thiamine-phosphate synthase enzyme
MTSATEYLWFETKRPRELVNITERVRAVVRKSGVRDGFCLVSAMHITAAVYVNDNESGLMEDILEWADRLAPPGSYRHHHTGESNGDAHLKNLLLGHQVLLPITRGDLDLGPWEQVFYAEFDGQRRKRVIVKVLGE